MSSIIAVTRNNQKRGYSRSFMPEFASYENREEVDGYSYGFQAQEKDDEIKGKGNSYNYTYRMHDTRLGRFFAVDPLSAKYPWNSSYAFSENKVIAWGELEGLESFYAANGIFIGSIGTSPKVQIVNDKDIDLATKYIGWANDMSDYGKENTQHNTDEAMKLSTTFPLDHTEFQKLSGLVAKEDHTNQETMNATAFSQKNRHTSMNSNGRKASVTEVFNTFGGSRSKDLHARMIVNRPLYKDYWSKTPVERNSYTYGGKNIFTMGQAAVIQAWLYPEKDNTNGATGWHGMDVLKSMPKVGHAYEDFQINYGFKWDANATIGKGAKISPENMPNHEGKDGQVLYKIGAAYGGSIYYKENPTKK